MNVRRRIGLVRLLAVAMLATGRLAGAEPSADSDRWQLLASAHADTGKAKAAAVETGIASVYSDRLQGRKTASGETYDPGRMTAAHRTLPFGTLVKVTNARTHRSAVVTINDRGPALAGRILDLSPRAAKALGIDPAGVARVTVEVVGDAPEKGSAK